MQVGSRFRDCQNQGYQSLIEVNARCGCYRGKGIKQEYQSLIEVNARKECDEYNFREDEYQSLIEVNASLPDL